MNGEEKQGLVTASHLVTKEDFADFKAAACRMAVKPSGVALVRAVGVFMALCGLALLIFAGGTAYRNAVCCLLVLAGTAVAFFYDAVSPVLVRWQAGNYFESHRERILAQTLIFYDREVRIKTDRYSALLPYGLLYEVYEDEKVFLLYTGPGEARVLPKRAVTQEDCLQLQRIFAENLKEKYKQEGAR